VCVCGEAPRRGQTLFISRGGLVFSKRCVFTVEGGIVGAPPVCVFITAYYKAVRVGGGG